MWTNPPPQKCRKVCSLNSSKTTSPRDQSLPPGNHNRLGFALKLYTVRFLGTFLEDPHHIPNSVVKNVADQLAIGDPACYAQYCVGEQRWEHTAEIRTRYGYQDFSAWPVPFRLNRWLYAVCWTGTRPPQQSCLIERRPGSSLIMFCCPASVSLKDLYRAFEALSKRGLGVC